LNDPAETSEFLAFTKAADAKSLSRAAAELGVPRATLGRRLARLEERLGVRLLRRTTRSLSLTEAGEAFYRHARIVLDAVSAAEQSVRRTDETLRGALRVSLPPMLDASLFGMLSEFHRAHPQVQLQAHFSTRHVDLLRDGFDVALRAGVELQPGLVARTLRKDPLVAVASPAYLEARGAPRSARDLRHHACLLGFARGELPQTHWPLLGGRKLRVEGAFASNEVTLLCDAALRGLGIAMLPGVVVNGPLLEGKLVHVLPDVLGADTRIAVVYPERQFVLPQVRAFVESIVSWASANDLSRIPQRPSCPEPRRRKKSA
jgi:DNA-binding transcriptional LysR family regulator